MVGARSRADASCRGLVVRTAGDGGRTDRGLASKRRVYTETYPLDIRKPPTKERKCHHPPPTLETVERLSRGQSSPVLATGGKIPRAGTLVCALRFSPHNEGLVWWGSAHGTPLCVPRSVRLPSCSLGRAQARPSALPPFQSGVAVAGAGQARFFGVAETHIKLQGGSCLTERNNDQISDIVTGWPARWNGRVLHNSLGS